MQHTIKKNILITGATSGIGKATAFDLATKGHKIILLSRDDDKLKSVKSEIILKTNNVDIHIVQCNLDSQRSIRNAANKIKKDFSIIDVLINNAGIHVPKLELTEDGIEKTFAVNHLAYFLLTGLLLENIKKAEQGRIINVSSTAHKRFKLDIDKIKDSKVYGRYPAYSRSKLANIMFTMDLAKRLKDTNVTVNSLHPGLILTNIGMDNPELSRRFVYILKKLFAKSPAKGAETIIYLATSEDVKDISGKYFVNKKIKKSSKESYDSNKRKDLWKLSEELTNLIY